MHFFQLYVQHRLTVGFHDEIKKQIEAFCAGFRFLVNSRVLGFFQPIELMEMIVGNENYEWSEFRKVGFIYSSKNAKSAFRPRKHLSQTQKYAEG